MAAEQIAQEKNIRISKNDPLIRAEEITMREITEADRESVHEMMRVFYASDAVDSNGSDEVFRNDIDECLSDSPFLTGYVFVRADESVGGYAMTAHSYCTEYGMQCVWIEDIYLQDDLRGMGLASAFFDYMKEKYPDCIHRLEAEDHTSRALEVYRRNGFGVKPYVELYRLPKA